MINTSFPSWRGKSDRRTVYCARGCCHKPLYDTDGNGIQGPKGDNENPLPIHPLVIQLGNCVFVVCSRECAIAIVQTELIETFYKGYPIF